MGFRRTVELVFVVGEESLARGNVDFCSRLRLTARIDPETRHFDLPVTPAFVLDQELFGINLDLCKQAKALIQHCLWNFREDWYRKTRQVPRIFEFPSGGQDRRGHGCSSPTLTRVRCGLPTNRKEPNNFLLADHPGVK